MYSKMYINLLIVIITLKYYMRCIMLAKYTQLLLIVSILYSHMNNNYCICDVKTA